MGNFHRSVHPWVSSTLVSLIVFSVLCISTEFQRVENQAMKLSNCPRYAFVANPNVENCGLGHRMGDVFMSFVFAIEYNATFVIQSSIFEAPSIHSNDYSWAKNFFGLGHVMTTSMIPSDNISEVSISRWDHASELGNACKVILKTCDTCCPNLSRAGIDNRDWCFINKLGAYGVAHPYFSKMFELSGFKPSVNHFIRSNAAVSVAWHVRLPNYDGDHVDNRLNSETFFDNIFATIQKITGELSFEIFVFSQRKLTQHDYLGKYNVTNVYNLGEADTLYHLAMADILVTSGSAFTSIAAVIHSPRSIVLQAPPRDTGNGVHWIPTFAMVDENGLLLQPEVSVLSDKLMALKKIPDTT